DTMESEISEVLEILRRQPSGSLLEFIVSEDGYKKIIGEREKSNRKYRVSYDSQSRIAIFCFPTSLHERTNLMVIDSMVDEAVRILQKAGVANDVTSRIQNAGHETTANSSRKKSYKEPDGLIILTTSSV
ncbi:hypothetical protein V1504DRAFT_461218, partial [Lipomyces starkeyi]